MGIEVNENVNLYSDIIYINNYTENFQYAWTRHEYIMHAMGSVEGHTLTNSLEAFIENYDAGCRVFEVDLNLTEGDKLVAVHDWSEETLCNLLGMDIPEEKRGVPLTQQEFLDLKIHDKYTTLSFEDVAKLMDEYHDIYVVLDTKEMNEDMYIKQYDVLVRTANEVNSDILNRIIPQMYSEEMYYDIMNIYQWRSMIYTVYGLLDEEYSEKQVMDFAYQNGIRVVTMFESRGTEIFIDELTKRNIRVFMHTFNSVEDYERIRSKGVDGIYTDILRPSVN